MGPKEQCLYVCQIRWTNQSNQISGRLLADSIAHPNSTMTQHVDKPSMEAACLEEAHARFTQANNTPFLIFDLHPYYKELGLLNCYEPHFDTIVNGTNQLPAGTSPGAQLLLSCLCQPPKHQTAQ